MDFDITEEDKIFAATVVDSGSQFVIESGKTWRAVIKLRRKSSAMLKPIHEKFGGGFSKAGGECSLTFRNQHATRFLRWIIGHLKVKVQHAHILMEFNVCVEEWQRQAAKGKPLTEEQIQRRSILQVQLRNANRIFSS